LDTFNSLLRVVKPTLSVIINSHHVCRVDVGGSNPVWELFPEKRLWVQSTIIYMIGAKTNHCAIVRYIVKVGKLYPTPDMDGCSVKKKNKTLPSVGAFDFFPHPKKK